MPQIWNVVQPLMTRLMRRRGHLAGPLLPLVLSVMLLIVHPAVLAKAVDQLEQLDRLRISLASSLEGSSEEPTMDTMPQVCLPVGKRAMAIGKENGWTVRQASRDQRGDLRGMVRVEQPERSHQQGCLIRLLPDGALCR